MINASTIAKFALSVMTDRIEGSSLGELSIRSRTLKVFCASVEAKRDLLISLDNKEYAYSRIKGSMNVDLRKWHDLGPHLCSKNVLFLAQQFDTNADFSQLKNGARAKTIFGKDKILQLEHVLPVDQIISLILQTDEGSCLESLIAETSCTAWILQEEDHLVKGRSYRASPRESYCLAGVNLMTKRGDHWRDFDWTPIESWVSR